jgi:hypothetical protein
MSVKIPRVHGKMQSQIFNKWQSKVHQFLNLKLVGAQIILTARLVLFRSFVIDRWSLRSTQTTRIPTLPFIQSNSTVLDGGRGQSKRTSQRYIGAGHFEVSKLPTPYKISHTHIDNKVDYHPTIIHRVV